MRPLPHGATPLTLNRCATRLLALLLLTCAAPFVTPSTADVAATTSNVLPLAVTSPAMVWHQFQDRVYVFGGSTDARVVEVNPHTKAASFKTAAFPTASRGMAAVDYGDFSGPEYVLRILVAGGTTTTASANIFRYTPSTNTLATSAAHFPQARSSVGIADGPDGIYLLGGASSETADVHSSIYRYTYWDDTLVLQPTSLPRPASHLFAHYYHQDGLFYLFHREQVWTYDPAAGQVNVLPVENPCGSGNGFGGAIEYDWDKVLLFGGTACPFAIVQFDLRDQTFMAMDAALPRASVGMSADLVPSLTGGPNVFYMVGAGARSLDSYDTPPGPPLNLVSTRPPIRGRIDLTWDLPAPNTYMWSGGADILNYEVWRSDAAGGPYTQLASGIIDPFHDAGLDDCTVVHYKVRGNHFLDGIGAFSQPLAAPTHCVPAAPPSAQAQATGPGEVTIMWEATEDDGGFPLQSYEITWLDGSGNLNDIWHVPPTETSFVHSGLDGASTVQYEIRALTELGGSDPATTNQVRVPILCGVPVLGCV